MPQIGRGKAFAQEREFGCDGPRPGAEQGPLWAARPENRRQVRIAAVRYRRARRNVPDSRGDIERGAAGRRREIPPSAPRRGP